MKNILLLFLALFIFVGCKDNTESVSSTRANNFTGVYYSDRSNNGNGSTHIWVITRKGNDKLALGYYLADFARIGNTVTSKKDVHFLENVTVTSDSTFVINESDAGAATPMVMKGTGTLKKRGDGSSYVAIGIDYLTASGQPARNAEFLEFSKVNNLLDGTVSSNDFDLEGTYSVLLDPEANSKTSAHKWTLTALNSTTFDLSYLITDRYPQGNIREIVTSYPIKGVKRVNQSLTIDAATEEEYSKNKATVKALSIKLLRDDQVPRIATIVRVNNEGQNIRTSEYIELRRE